MKPLLVSCSLDGVTRDLGQFGSLIWLQPSEVSVDSNVISGRPLYIPHMLRDHTKGR